MDQTQTVKIITACPQAPLLLQWTELQAGFQRLTSRLYEEVTERTGLPASSVQILLHLLTSPPDTVQMTHLARRLEFSTAGITKVTDRLLAAGLIERTSCVTDRRIVRANLTPKGYEVAQEASRVLADAINREVVGKIGPKDFDRFAELLAALDDGR